MLECTYAMVELTDFYKDHMGSQKEAVLVKINRFPCSVLGFELQTQAQTLYTLSLSESSRSSLIVFSMGKTLVCVFL